MSLTSGIAGASDAARSMRVGIETGAEPMSFIKPDGEVGGFAVAIVDAVAREMGVEVQSVVGPWEQILQRFRSGEIDVLASLAYTKERDAFVDYAVSHLRLRGRIFVRRGQTQIRTASDLANCRVAVQRDSFSHEYLRARGWDGGGIYVRDFHEALLAIEQGRCDAVMAVGVIGNHVVQKMGLKNVVASDVPLPDFEFSLHMGVRAGDADRLAWLNEGLARIRANGIYDKIYAQWIGPLDSRPLRLQDLRPYSAPAFAVLAVFVIAFLRQRHFARQNARQAAKSRES